MTKASDSAAVYIDPVATVVPAFEEPRYPVGVSSDVAAKYRYWRIRIMYAMIFGYATFYLVRMNFAMAMPTMVKEFGYTKTQLGWIITIFSIVYGSGKFINGYLSDRSNARYFITIGLLGSAVINIVMGFGESLLFFGIFWGINAWFQSMAWPPIARLLTHWFSPTELGTKWALWASSHQIGGAVIFVLAGYLIANHGLQSAFFVPGVISLGVAVLLFNRLRDTPNTLGLPPVEVYKNLIDINDVVEEEDISSKEILRRVFASKVVWYVGLANMFLYIVRLGVFNWAPTFLQEMKGSTLVQSAWQGVGCELAGIAGGILAGMASDRLFAGRRGPVGCLYMAALIFVLLYFWLMPAGYIILDTIAMFGVGFFVWGPQVLAGVAAADFASKKAAGTATGFIGTLGYVGGGISGVGIGYTADVWGWQGGFLFFIASAICGMFFFALTWNQKPRALEKS